MKYCTLKDLTPGTIVELPHEYQGREGETAVVLGLEYTFDKRGIRTEYLKRDGEMFVARSIAPQPEDTKLAVVDDQVLQQASIKAFVTNKFFLPERGMSCGCDPEVFVEHADGSIFPAWEFMP